MLRIFRSRPRNFLKILFMHEFLNLNSNIHNSPLGPVQNPKSTTFSLFIPVQNPQEIEEKNSKKVFLCTVNTRK
jgi:hypothetical protein